MAHLFSYTKNDLHTGLQTCKTATVLIFTLMGTDGQHFRPFQWSPGFTVRSHLPLEWYSHSKGHGSEVKILHGRLGGCIKSNGKRRIDTHWALLWRCYVTCVCSRRRPSCGACGAGGGHAACVPRYNNSDNTAQHTSLHSLSGLEGRGCGWTVTAKLQLLWGIEALRA